jgi:hypothetical protein
MTSRGFSILLIGGTFFLFLATVAANVTLDPEQVFGTGLYSHRVNINERVVRLRQYQRQADSVDGLLFSSSRGNLLDPNLLEKGMGLSHFASASMSYGMVSDYVPLLEYIVGDKATRSVKLKHVFLLLDVDFFGRPSWTNSNINSFLPPEISEESAARFWWRYLTAFQYRLWRDVIREDRRRSEQARAAAASGAVDAARQINPAEAMEGVRSPLVREEYRRGWNAVRPDLDRQLALLQRLVALCRENQIRLTVAISPLQAWNLDLNGRAEIDALTQRLSRITPLFDFNAFPLIADKDEYWLDNSHFNERAGTMMLARIFGTGADIGWGELRGADNDDGQSSAPRRLEGGLAAPRAMNETPLDAR